jgi:hypothetical protein
LKLECQRRRIRNLNQCEICVDLRARGQGGRAVFCWCYSRKYRGRRSSCPRPCPSLFLWTRGKALPQPSEHLLRDSTDQFLKEIYHQYDYIIIDSSPVLATDDTTSLSPKIDATLLVVRLSHTSARLTKKALELLYSRQVNIPGIILNYVDTSLPEYYY